MRTQPTPDPRQTLDYRPRASRPPFRWRLHLLLAVLAGVLHFAASHVILFHVHSPIFYNWSGPAGPTPTLVVALLEQPLYPQETHWYQDLGRWHPRFVARAAENAAIWGCGFYAAALLAWLYRRASNERNANG